MGSTDSRAVRTAAMTQSGRFRLIVSDIDGTIINSRQEITPRTKRAVQRVVEEGYKFVLATGRRYRSTLPVVRELGLDLPVILHSGALIKETRTHRSLCVQLMSRPAWSHTASAMKAHGLHPIVLADTFATGIDAVVEDHKNAHAGHQAYVAANARYLRVVERLESVEIEDVIEVVCFGDEGVLRRVERHIEETSDSVSCHVLRIPKYKCPILEVFDSRASKWAALEFLAARENVVAAQTIAIGDDVNDLEMIRNAGLGVAMGNAPSCVKSSAHFVAPPADDDGLARFLEERLLS